MRYCHQRGIMAASTAAAPTAELTLLIDGYLAGAIIGKGGSTLKSIKSASGVLTLQPMLTSTPGRATRAGLLRAVRTRGTGQLAPGVPSTARMLYAYQPRACLMCGTTGSSSARRAALRRAR